jgi:hypothetical protein
MTTAVDLDVGDTAAVSEAAPDATPSADTQEEADKAA